MIHTVGDSHAEHTFAGIAGVVTHHLGPVTLKRVGYLEDELLPATVRALALRPADVLILCFGEIDVRCYVKPQMVRPGLDLDGLLSGWVERYLARATTLETNGARVGVLSVVPPVPRERAANAHLPVAGSEDERATYTRAINRILAAACAVHGALFVDVYSACRDDHGMLPLDLTDGCVHVQSPVRVSGVLRELELLP
jgi:hypothetical protein